MLCLLCPLLLLSPLLLLRPLLRQLVAAWARCIQPAGRSSLLWHLWLRPLRLLHLLHPLSLLLCSCLLHNWRPRGPRWQRSSAWAPAVTTTLWLHLLALLLPGAAAKRHSLRQRLLLGRRPRCQLAGWLALRLGCPAARRLCLRLVWNCCWATGALPGWKSCHSPSPCCCCC